ncbi:hypothetical protein EDB86DRAFT_2828951 [Lactarius hatsudake]|nr:hypothetical protein EDB86DRAFT_2831913 [Lactarius hatsudake]KAH8997213.1 hypothetical protein EDB86DRAFT_2828951 [Lactarius hatsudake]
MHMSAATTTTPYSVQEPPQRHPHTARNPHRYDANTPTTTVMRWYCGGNSMEAGLMVVTWQQREWRRWRVGSSGSGGGNGSGGVSGAVVVRQGWGGGGNDGGGTPLLIFVLSLVEPAQARVQVEISQTIRSALNDFEKKIVNCRAHHPTGVDKPTPKHVCEVKRDERTRLQFKLAQAEKVLTKLPSNGGKYQRRQVEHSSQIEQYGFEGCLCLEPLSGEDADNAQFVKELRELVEQAMQRLKVPHLMRNLVYTVRRVGCGRLVHPWPQGGAGMISFIIPVAPVIDDIQDDILLVLDTVIGRALMDLAISEGYGIDREKRGSAIGQEIVEACSFMLDDVLSCESSIAVKQNPWQCY